MMRGTPSGHTPRMASTAPCRLFCISLLIASLGCGDDGGGSTADTGSTGTAPTGSGPAATDSEGPGSGSTEGSAGATEGDTDVTTATAGDTTAGDTAVTGDDSGGATSSGSTDTGGDGSSSDDGMTLPGCEMCEEGEVCVANQSFMTTYECQPMPKACKGEVDCECGGSLCVDPFVGCSVPPEPNTLFCACIAC